MSNPVFIYRSFKHPIADKNALICQCGRDYFRTNGLAESLLEIVVDPFGKPDFTQSIHFSISHSHHLWVCAISQTPLGIDVEYHRECNQHLIANRFFHPKERDHILNDIHDFFNVWCAKESFVKYSGKGITDEFSSFTVIEDGRMVSAIKDVKIHLIPIADNYSCCLSITGSDGYRIIDLDQ